MGLEAPVKERHGTYGIDPEEGHKNNHKAGAPLLREQAEEAGFVQSGEERHWGDLISVF